jgi:8-oxo-dGTP pyrophosphatase MutT (NUDIX family)
MRNAFAMGALRGADGGFVLGRMAGWTANAGRIYFAAGTPDPEDVTATGVVDLDGSVMRELGEETGLGADDVTGAPGWHAVFIGARIALMRPLTARLHAEGLAERIRAHLAQEERPELDDVVIARGPGDLSEAMPPFIRAYLMAVWNGLTD